MYAKKISVIFLAVISSACQLFNNQSISTENSLELTSISPLAPKAVSESTVIEATFKYSIKNYEKDKYYIIAQFDTCTPDLTYDGDMPKSEYAYPQSANGEISFKFPMKYVWGQEIISHPYKVRFFLNRVIDEESSQPVAQTGPVIYVPEIKK